MHSLDLLDERSVLRDGQLMDDVAQMHQAPQLGCLSPCEVAPAAMTPSTSWLKC